MTAGQRASGAGPRAFRGLFLVFFLSFFNLVGVIVTLTALGGFDPWSRWQFIGAFGALEIAAGLANVITPNVWRLPVAELATSDRTETALAGSTLLMPHWGALARCAAGVVCLAVAAVQEGVGAASAALVPLLVLLAWLIVGISALAARVGVAWPDYDVFQLSVRWGGRDRELAPVSIGAATFQFVLSIITIPAVKLLPPSVLFQPEMAPSAAALAVTAAAGVALVAAVWAAWGRRVRWQAPREQQREAEEHA